MGAILFFMTFVVLVAALALVYAAFPHRGEPVPGAPWLGEVLERAAEALPVLEDGDLDPRPEPTEHDQHVEPSRR